MYIDTFFDSPIFFELFDSFQFIYQYTVKNPAKIRLSRHCVRKMLEGRNHACRKPTNGIVKPPKPSGFGVKSGCGGRTRISQFCYLAFHSLHCVVFCPIWNTNYAIFQKPRETKGKKKGKIFSSPRLSCRFPYTEEMGFWGPSLCFRPGSQEIPAIPAVALPQCE